MTRRWICLTLAFLGCGGAPSESPKAKSEDGAKTAVTHDDHHDHGSGPHGGTVVDWGGGRFHVEFVVDHDQKQAEVYVLDDDEKSPVAIAADEVLLSLREPAVQISLKPAPQQSDPEGAASRFVGVHEALGVVQEFAGTISAAVDGVPYAADFEEHAHDHEE